MSGYTDIIRIALAVLFVLMVLSIVVQQFSTGKTELLSITADVTETTSKYDTVLYELYDNNTITGYDARLAVTNYCKNEYEDWREDASTVPYSLGDFDVYYRKQCPDNYYYWFYFSNDCSNKLLTLRYSTTSNLTKKITGVFSGKTHYNPYYFDPKQSYHAYLLVDKGNGDEQFSATGNGILGSMLEDNYDIGSCNNNTKNEIRGILITD